MNDSREDRLEQWMRTTFEKAFVPTEHYPVFTQLFRSIYEGVCNGEKIDTLEDPAAPLEADDPNSPTASSCVEGQTLDKLKCYLGKLAEGHSSRFAFLYALEASCPPGGDDRDSQEVFYKIYQSAMQEDLTSPAYLEAFQVCVHQAKSEFYAHQCGKALMGNDFNLHKARVSAAKYEAAFHACLRRGRSLLYASLYADAMVFLDLVNWAAAAYAWSYESQIRLGRSRWEASRYASIYEDHFDKYSSGEEMEEGSGYSEIATVYTEAEVRWDGKPCKKDTYISHFVNCYHGMDKDPIQPMTEWFSALETRTDQKCAS